MADLIWVMVSRQSLVDQSSNQVTLVNIVEQISGPADAEIFGIELVVTTLWRRTEEGDEEVTYRLQWQDHLEKEIRSIQPVSFTIAEGTERHRMFTKIHGLPIREPGRCSFVVECLADDGEYKELRRYNIEIKRQTEA